MAERINNSFKTMNHGITKFMVLNVSKKDHKMLMAFFVCLLCSVHNSTPNGRHFLNILRIQIQIISPNSQMVGNKKLREMRVWWVNEEVTIGGAAANQKLRDNALKDLPQFSSSCVVRSVLCVCA